MCFRWRGRHYFLAESFVLRDPNDKLRNCLKLVLIEAKKTLHGQQGAHSLLTTITKATKLYISCYY